MTTNSQLKKAFAAVMPLPFKEAFIEVKTSYLCFARQRGPFVDRLSIWVTRHGNFADATATIWSPYLTMTSGVHGKDLDVERMSPVIGGDLSVRRVRESWMWDVRPDMLASTIGELAEAVQSVALPWFDSINSDEALVRECALNPDYWRKVPRAEREAIGQSVDKALRGEVEITQFRLLDEKSAAQAMVPAQDTVRPIDEDAYEQVSLPHRSEANPSLTGTVISLRKKKKKAPPEKP